MPRFLMQLALATLVLLGLWNALYVVLPLQIFGYDFAIWQAKFELLEAAPDGTEVLILGDSSVIAGLSPSEMKRGTLNLALPCGGPIEASIVYERYRAKHPAPKVLALQFTQFYYEHLKCFAQFSLAFDNLSITEKAGLLRKFEGAAAKVPLFGDDEKFFETVRAPHWFRHGLFLSLTALHIAPMQIQYAQNLLRPSFWKFYESDYRKSVAQRGHFAIADGASYDGLRTLDFEFDEFRPNPAIVEGLESIIQRARIDGSKVIVRLGPLNPASTAHFSSRHREQVARFFLDLESRYPGLQTEKAIRVWPADAFGDEALHMNERGTRLESAHFEAAIDRLLE